MSFAPAFADGAPRSCSMMHCCESRACHFDDLPPNQLVHLLRAFPPTCHTELVARPFVAVPRGSSRGFLAAETGRPLPLPSRPLKQTHGASPKGSTLPCTMQNATLGARGASPREVAHAERRWRMHGGKTHPRRGSAAAHGGKASFLRLVRGRLAATSHRSSSSSTSSRHISSPTTRP